MLLFIYYRLSIYHMILNTIQKKESWNFVQNMNSEKTPHTLPYGQAMSVFS